LSTPLSSCSSPSSSSASFSRYGSACDCVHYLINLNSFFRNGFNLSGIRQGTLHILASLCFSLLRTLDHLLEYTCMNLNCPPGPVCRSSV
jgi:hypothetical protein